MSREWMRWLVSIYQLRRQSIVGRQIRRSEWSLAACIRIWRPTNLPNRHIPWSRSTRCWRTHSCSKRRSSTACSRSVVLGFVQVPHFECIAQLWYSDCWRVEEIVRFWCNSNGLFFKFRMLTESQVRNKIIPKSEQLSVY